VTGQDPEPRAGHLWTLLLALRGASSIHATDDTEPRDYRFADYQTLTRPVQVQAASLRAALHAAADRPLAEFLHPADHDDRPVDRTHDTTWQVLTLAAAHSLPLGRVTIEGVEPAPYRAEFDAQTRTVIPGDQVHGRVQMLLPLGGDPVGALLAWADVLGSHLVWLQHEPGHRTLRTTAFVSGLAWDVAAWAPLGWTAPPGPQHAGRWGTQYPIDVLRVPR
jgi:hypothetical protein